MSLSCLSFALLLVASARASLSADTATAETKFVQPYYYGGHVVAPVHGYVTPVVQPVLHAGLHGAGVGAGYGVVGKGLVASGLGAGIGYGAVGAGYGAGLAHGAVGAGLAHGAVGAGLAHGAVGAGLAHGAVGAGYGAGVGYGVAGAGYGAGLGYGAVGAGLGSGLLVGGVGGRHFASNGFNGGLVNAGGNSGAHVLGNKGQQIYQQAVDGGFKGGVYHQGGGFKNGGYQGVQGYNDNKHHLADDHSHQQYYAGTNGGKANLGNGEVYDKNQGYAVNAYNALGDSMLKNYQKGHKKAGFRKSYHKDETGNDETFYDTDHDEGNYQHGKKYGDQFETDYLSGMAGKKNVNQFAVGQQGSRAAVGNGKLVAHDQGVKDYYGKTGFYDNGNHYGGSGGVQASGLAKVGVNHGFQNGFQNGFHNGKNYAGQHHANFGSGLHAPYLY